MNKFNIKKGIDKSSKKDRTVLQISKDVLLCLKEAKHGELIFLLGFIANMGWFLPTIFIITKLDDLINKKKKKF